MARETLDTTYATAAPANSKEARSNDVGGPNGFTPDPLSLAFEAVAYSLPRVA
jgi:hypothetical protein